MAAAAAADALLRATASARRDRNSSRLAAASRASFAAAARRAAVASRVRVSASRRAAAAAAAAAARSVSCRAAALNRSSDCFEGRGTNTAERGAEREHAAQSSSDHSRDITSTTKVGGGVRTREGGEPLRVRLNGRVAVPTRFGRPAHAPKPHARACHGRASRLASGGARRPPRRAPRRLALERCARPLATSPQDCRFNRETTRIGHRCDLGNDCHAHNTTFEHVARLKTWRTPMASRERHIAPQSADCGGGAAL